MILVLDLSQPTSLHTVSGSVASIISRNFPFRFGIVPLAESEDGPFLFPSTFMCNYSWTWTRREDGAAVLPFGARIRAEEDHGVLEEGVYSAPYFSSYPRTHTSVILR